jgi:hypothetical protein
MLTRSIVMKQRAPAVLEYFLFPYVRSMPTTPTVAPRVSEQASSAGYRAMDAPILSSSTNSGGSHESELATCEIPTAHLRIVSSSLVLSTCTVACVPCRAIIITSWPRQAHDGSFHVADEPPELRCFHTALERALSQRRVVHSTRPQGMPN